MTTPDRPEPSERRRAIVNVGSNWGAFAVSAAIGFLLSPFIVHHLGDQAYGVWVLLGSLVGYLGLLDLGVRGAVTTYVATHHAGARHEEAGHLLSAALVLFGIAGAVAIAASCAFAIFGLHLFSLPPDLVAVARLVLVIGGVNLAVSLVFGVYGGAVVGVQRFDLMNVVNVVSNLVRAAAIVVALGAGGGLVALASIQLGVSLATGLGVAGLSRRVYPELRIGLRGFGRGHLRAIVSYGAFASLIQIANIVMGHTDTIVIGAALPVAQVTFFAIAANLIDYARQVVSGISQTMTPLAGALRGSDRSHDVANALLTGSRLATLLLLPILITFVFRGASFIGLWMGPGYAAPSGAVLIVLSLARWPAAGYQVGASTLLGLNRHRGLVPAVGLETVANLALSIWLVHPLGITGVAIGTLLPRLVVTLVYGPWYLRGQVGLSRRRYYTEVVLRPLIALTPFALGTIAIERLMPAASLLTFFGQVALTLPLAAAGAWAAALHPGERRLLSGALGRALAAGRPR